MIGAIYKSVKPLATLILLLAWTTNTQGQADSDDSLVTLEYLEKSPVLNDFQVFSNPLHFSSAGEGLSIGPRVEVWIPLHNRVRLEASVFHPFYLDEFRLFLRDHESVNMKDKYPFTRFLEGGGAITLYHRRRSETVRGAFDIDMKREGGGTLRTFHVVNYDVPKSRNLDFRYHILYQSPMFIGAFKVPGGGLFRGIEVLTDTSQYVLYNEDALWSTRYHTLTGAIGFSFTDYENNTIVVQGEHEVKRRVYRGGYIDFLYSMQSWFAPIESELFSERPIEYYSLGFNVQRARTVGFGDRMGFRMGYYWFPEQYLTVWPFSARFIVEVSIYPQMTNSAPAAFRFGMDFMLN